MALGLAVAIMASASYKYLSSCMAGFDIEMRIAARAIPYFVGTVTDPRLCSARSNTITRTC